MAIPEHVRRQAMDAVSHRETTEFMRMFGFSERGASLFSAPLNEPKTARHAPITDEVKREAMDAVAHRETTAHVRLVRDTGSVAVPATPSPASRHAAERVTELHSAGTALDAVQRQITQDGFGRLYG